MIKTPFTNRSRDRKPAGPYGENRGRRDMGQRRDNVSPRERSTVVHPWMSLPDKLAATQAAMRELAGTAAFQCPLGEAYRAPDATPADDKPRSRGVNIVFRKRRLPAAAIPELANAS